MKYILGVSGTPGCGKSTFCKTLKNHFGKLNRRAKIFNLDVGCEHSMAYAPDWNITDVVKVSEIMRIKDLGFNGALMEGMKKFFEEDIEILMEKIKESEDNTLIILDLPGQVELFTVRDSVKNFYDHLTHTEDFRVCNIYMFEANILREFDFFVAYATNITMSMLHLAVPQLNLVSKIDIMYHAKNRDKLDTPFEHFTNVLHLTDTEMTIDGMTAERREPKNIISRLLDLNKHYSLLNLTAFTALDDKFITLLCFQIDRSLGWLVDPVTARTFADEISKEESSLLDYTEVFLEKCVRVTRK